MCEVRCSVITAGDARARWLMYVWNIFVMG
jgi:hypothetical protein